MIVFCGISKAQTDTNYVPTHKHVLKYLFEQDAKVVFLKKDTLNKGGEIKALKEVVAEKDKEVGRESEKVAIEKKSHELTKIETDKLRNSNKKLSKQKTAIGILGVITNALKTFFIGYLLIK